jgi:hypothetical protein
LSLQPALDLPVLSPASFVTLCFGLCQSGSDTLPAVDGRTSIANLDAVARSALSEEPYRWAVVEGFFSGASASELITTFPEEPYQTVIGDDGEKGYEYEARLLVGMGAAEPAHREQLSPVWVAAARDLVSSAYRASLSELTGLDLRAVPVEVNACHYGPGGWLGPHADLTDKLVTHVLYFNDNWDPVLGGCLRILRSPNLNDVAAELGPNVDQSVVIVRSECSYHAVTPVAGRARDSRRSVTITFYRPGSVSTLWPPDAEPSLHRFRLAA